MAQQYDMSSAVKDGAVTCLKCGVLVGFTEVHDRWHDELEDVLSALGEMVAFLVGPIPATALPPEVLRVMEKYRLVPPAREDGR